MYLYILFFGQMKRARENLLFYNWFNLSKFQNATSGSLAHHCHCYCCSGPLEKTIVNIFFFRRRSNSSKSYFKIQVSSSYLQRFQTWSTQKLCLSFSMIYFIITIFSGTKLMCHLCQVTFLVIIGHSRKKLEIRWLCKSASSPIHCFVVGKCKAQYMISHIKKL